MHIAISRTDSIGDVLMTLPFTAFLREKYPQAKISFVANPYTFPVLRATKIIDNIITPHQIDKSITHFFLVYPRFEIAKRAFLKRIPIRIATSRRIYNRIFCNHLVNFSRKKSNLNEAQLNFFLYKALDKNFEIPSIKTIRRIVTHQVKLTPYAGLKKELIELLNSYKYKVILHPKSRGSAREYPITLWKKIIPELYSLNNVGFFFTGTQQEYLQIKNFVDKYSQKNVHNLMGRLDLAEFITFISYSNLLVANSTGPLHIASFLQKDTIGLFPTLHGIDKKRWEPVGKPSTILEPPNKCIKCTLKRTNKCQCMWNIEPETIIKTIQHYAKDSLNSSP